MFGAQSSCFHNPSCRISRPFFPKMPPQTSTKPRKSNRYISWGIFIPQQNIIGFVEPGQIIQGCLELFSLPLILFFGVWAHPNYSSQLFRQMLGLSRMTCRKKKKKVKYLEESASTCVSVCVLNADCRPTTEGGNNSNSSRYAYQYQSVISDKSPTISIIACSWIATREFWKAIFSFLQTDSTSGR